jgi:hypothetical protein
VGSIVGTKAALISEVCMMHAHGGWCQMGWPEKVIFSYPEIIRLALETGIRTIKIHVIVVNHSEVLDTYNWFMWFIAMM